MPNSAPTWEDTQPLESTSPKWGDTEPVEEKPSPKPPEDSFAGKVLKIMEATPYRGTSISLGASLSPAELLGKTTRAIATPAVEAAKTLRDVLSPTTYLPESEQPKQAVIRHDAQGREWLGLETPEERKARVAREEPIQLGKGLAGSPTGPDASRLLNRWTTPEGLLMLPLGMTRAGALLLLSSLPETFVQQVSDVIKGKGTEEQKRDTVNDLFANAALITRGLSKGPKDAQRIRSDTGQPDTTGLRPGESQADRGRNLEQAPPQPAQPVAQGKEEAQAKEVAAVQQHEDVPELQPGEVIESSAVLDKGKPVYGANHPEILEAIGGKELRDKYPTRESRNTPMFGFKTNQRDFVPRKALGDVHSDEVSSVSEPGKSVGEQSGRDWEAFYEELTGDLDSFSPARITGKINYELEDAASRFVDYAKADKSGKPLDKLVSDFAKTDKASASQISKIRKAVKSVLAAEKPAAEPPPSLPGEAQPSAVTPTAAKAGEAEGAVAAAPSQPAIGEGGLIVSKTQEAPTELKSLRKADVKDDPRLEMPGITKKSKPNSIVVALRDLESRPVREIVRPATGDPLADSKTVLSILKQYVNDPVISQRESLAVTTGKNGRAIYKFGMSPNGIVWSGAKQWLDLVEQSRLERESQVQPKEPATPPPAAPTEGMTSREQAAGVEPVSREAARKGAAVGTKVGREGYVWEKRQDGWYSRESDGSFVRRPKVDAWAENQVKKPDKGVIVREKPSDEQIQWLKKIDSTRRNWKSKPGGTIYPTLEDIGLTKSQFNQLKRKGWVEDRGFGSDITTSGKFESDPEYATSLMSIGRPKFGAPIEESQLQALTEKVESGAKLTPAEQKKYLALRQEATGTKPEVKPEVEAGVKPDKGIAASVRRGGKWSRATSQQTGEAGFINIDPLKDLIDRTTPYVKAAFLAVKEAAKQNFDIRKANDFRRSILNWSSKLQTSFGEAAAAQKEIRKTVPKPIRRDGITNWIQAGGDKTILAQRRADTAAWRDPVTGKPHPQQKRLLAGYDAALNLTSEEINIANEVKQTYDDLLNRGMTYDVINSFKDNYVTQIWNLKQGPRSMGTSRMLRDKFRFAKASTFPTFFDGEQAGYVPKTKDISKLLPVYLHEMNSVIAARQLVEQMSGGFASDGRPLLAARGVGVAVDGPKGKATLVIPTVPKGAKVGAPGSKTAVDTSDYVFVENQPALHEWVYATKDSAGNPVFHRGDLMVHPEVAAHFKNVLGRSAIKEWYESRTSATAAIPKAIAKGLDVAQSVTKQTMLGLLTPFHQVQEGTHAIGHRVNPFGNIPEIDLVNNLAQKDAAAHGLMLLPDRTSAQQFMEGFRQAGIVGKIPFLGELATHYQDYLFHRYIPGLKFKTYEAILRRNTKVYEKDIASGKATLEDVKLLSAEQANAAYGHLNYADLGRNPTMMHLARLALLAPDFLEARARFAGQAIKGIGGAKIGREQLIALSTLAIAQATASWTAAHLTGGQWDGKDPFTFHVGNRKFTMRSVPEDLYRSGIGAIASGGGFSQFSEDARRFWYARMNPLLLRGAWQYVSGVDWRGRKVGAGETTKELLQQPIPLSVRPLFGLSNTSLTTWEELASAAGLKITRYSQSSEMFKKAHEWMASSPEPKIRLAEQRYQRTVLPDSDYKPLREALIKGDDSDARRQYDTLRKTRTREQILRAFDTERPFTGSNAAEAKFRQSLDEEGKAAYAAARKEHKDLARKLRSVLSSNP